MHDLKYFLIILFSFLLTGFTSCINQESVPDVLSSLPFPEGEGEGEIIPPSSETSSEESESLAECIKGVYSGNAFFRGFVNGEQTNQQYALEVSHNSNEMIFLMTSEGEQFCTTYQNPSFSATNDDRDNDYFDIESDSIEYKGIIGVVTGISYSASQSKRDSMDCSLSGIRFDPDSDGNISLGNINLNKSTQELRSFANIKSDCDSLATARGGGAAR